MALVLVRLDAFVVSTALSTIRVDVGASVERLEWTVNAYTLTFALFMMTAAALGARFGRCRVFVAGVGVFAVASVACALAPSAGWLIAARAVWGLVRGNSAGWGSAEVVLALALGASLTVAFVVRETRTREPMLPMRLFWSRSFSAGNAAMFFLWASAFGAMFFMAQFLQAGLGFGPLDAGVRLVPWGVAAASPAVQSAVLSSAAQGERRQVLGCVQHGAVAGADPAPTPVRDRSSPAPVVAVGQRQDGHEEDSVTWGA